MLGYGGVRVAASVMWGAGGGGGGGGACAPFPAAPPCTCPTLFFYKINFYKNNQSQI